jgi:EAL domain-containing protein (putative c-di-GMP-specific phosphodiesterase class I)
MRPTLLDRSLEPGALRTLFQPIFDISGGRPVMCAVEALTRGPAGTTVECADLLFAYARRKLAEAELDRTAVAQALAAAEPLAASGLGLHLNVHASTLGADPGFADLLLAAAGRHGFPPARVTVEVVEQADPLSREAFAAAIGRLRDDGFAIALDDVGLGSSNFLMLYLTRAGVLKADRFFVHGVCRDPMRRAVVAAVQRLAEEVGARVVAEGVEDPGDLEELRRLGVREAQGYLLARPMPAERLLERLAGGGPSAMIAAWRGESEAEDPAA